MTPRRRVADRLAWNAFMTGVGMVTSIRAARDGRLVWLIIDVLLMMWFGSLALAAHRELS